LSKKPCSWLFLTSFSATENVLLTLKRAITVLGGYLIPLDESTSLLICRKWDLNPRVIVGESYFKMAIPQVD